jgi:diguanylate cyclase (GGDEF)-like protein
MLGRASHILDRLLDVGDAKTEFGRSLLRERYDALGRQVPLLYLIALANFTGAHVAMGGPPADFFHPLYLLAGLVVLRLVHWLLRRSRVLEPEQILVELRRTWIIAAILSLGFGYWSVRLVATGEADVQDRVILFCCLAAIGCAYGLSSFPSAARLSLILCGMPLSIWLLFSNRISDLALGTSLILVTLLVLRLVNVQNRGFVRLVETRSSVEAERERARAAERKARVEQRRAKRMADTDALTGLASRRAFITALEHRLADAEAGPFMLAVVDLDGFKPINDTFGHSAGDAVLIEVSRRLRAHEAEDGLAARIGGDEFALIVPRSTVAAGGAVGQRICDSLARPYLVHGREFRVSACCGLAMLKPGAISVESALARGDAALYHAKQRGRGGAAMFSRALDKANRRRVAIERALRSEEVQGDIGLVFQPILNLGTGELHAFEALARWRHPELGDISPAEFIPIIEHINLVERISDGLLRCAAGEAARWPDAVRLSFNLSAVQLCAPRSAERILKTIAASRLDPTRLQIEVTETTLLADFESARRNLRHLRAAGVRIVLDDFGAGFASISYLREISFDAIKLDGSLVTSALGSTAATRLLKGVLELCSSLGVPCIAEHIETDDQLALLRQLKCHQGQGFILSAPIGADEAAEMAATRLLAFPTNEAAAS